jgi:hypothetical protein
MNTIMQHFPWCESDQCDVRVDDAEHFGATEAFDAKLVTGHVCASAWTDLADGHQIVTPRVLLYAEDTELDEDLVMRLSADEARDLAMKLLRVANVVDPPLPQSQTPWDLGGAVRTILGAQPAYDPRAGIVEDGAAR